MRFLTGSKKHPRLLNMTSKKSSKALLSPSSLKSPATEKGDYTLHQSFITSQDEIDTILHQFGITDVETRVPGPSGRINNPPKGFFAFSPIHIWHSGYLPLSDFLIRFLAHLGVAPIQLLPNCYTYLSCLQVLSREANTPLDVDTLCSMVSLTKAKNQPEGTLYRLHPLHKGVISNMINRTKEWENQFFYVRSHSPRIKGTFSTPKPAPKEVGPSSAIKIEALSVAVKNMGDRLKLLIESNLQKYSLILDNHRVLGEPPMIKKNTQGTRSLVVGNPDAFSVHSPIQRDVPHSLRYSPDVNLTVQTSKGKNVETLPSCPKKATKATPLIAGTVADALRIARDRKRDRDAKKPTDISNLPPGKKSKIDKSQQLTVIGEESRAVITTIDGDLDTTDLGLKDQDPKVQVSNLVGTSSTQSTIIDIMGSSPADVFYRFKQDLGLTLYSDPLLLEGSNQSLPSDFESLIHSVVQSPMVSSLIPLQPPTFSGEHLCVLFQQLLVVAKHMFLLQRTYSDSSDQIPSLKHQNSVLADQIKTLESRTLEISNVRDKTISENDKLAACLNEERKAKQVVEDRMKFLERELDLAKAESSQSAIKVTDLETKVATLEDKLSKKDAALVHSKATVRGAKEKVSSFINQALPQWQEQCYEHAFFLAYQDNIEKCSDMDFPSLPALNDKFKRKFDLMLSRVPGSLDDEFPEEEPIDLEKLLSFDEPLSEEDTVDKDDSDEDDDNNDGDEARNKNGSGPNDKDDGANDQGLGSTKHLSTLETNLFDQPGSQDIPHKEDISEEASTSRQQKVGPSATKALALTTQVTMGEGYKSSANNGENYVDVNVKLSNDDNHNDIQCSSGNAIVAIPVNGKLVKE